MNQSKNNLSFILGIGIAAGWYLATIAQRKNQRVNGLQVAQSLMKKDTAEIATFLKEAAIRELALLNLSLSELKPEKVESIIADIIDNVPYVGSRLTADKRQQLTAKLAEEIISRKSLLTDTKR